MTKKQNKEVKVSNAIDENVSITANANTYYVGNTSTIITLNEELTEENNKLIERNEEIREQLYKAIEIKEGLLDEVEELKSDINMHYFVNSNLEKELNTIKSKWWYKLMAW